MKTVTSKTIIHHKKLNKSGKSLQARLKDPRVEVRTNRRNNLRYL